MLLLKRKKLFRSAAKFLPPYIRGRKNRLLKNSSNDEKLRYCVDSAGSRRNFFADILFSQKNAADKNNAVRPRLFFLRFTVLLGIRAVLFFV